MKSLFFLAFIFFATALTAQTNFIRKDSVPVFLNSQQLEFAWTGGMNYTQFSEIDLNQDGIRDLFIFDRTGNKISTFINLGIANQVSYVPAMEYVSQFPRMHDWVLLRDYNCDGKVDILTSNASQIVVYKNISTLATGLQFQLISNAIQADITPNSTHLISSVYVSWIDIPAIHDVDGDGDLDILNFGLNGYQVEYYKNMSQENYGTCDSLHYILETLCWGEFIESQSNSTITLNTSCPAPPIRNNDELIHNAFLHAGSCLECLNVDGDNDVELLVGDLANTYINLLRNGGSSNNAVCDSIDTFYPGYDTAMAIQIFGCAFHVDVDNDNKRDLLFSPNALNTSENFKSAWYYHNYGADDSVRSHFIENRFMQNKMIEVGEGTYPTFFDFDSDGDKDLFIGTKGYYDPTGIPQCMLACFENTGSSSAPVFTHKSSDFSGIYTGGLILSGLYPTFGDLDGDGDGDMLLGDNNGRLNYFRKDPGSDTNFVFVQAYFDSIDVGSSATPQLIDVDRDGKLDLLIGEQTGNVNYYRNIGTTTNPNFDLITPLFGNVIVTQAGFTTGYSAPCLYDDNGNFILLVGCERGFLFRFDSIDGNLSGNFTLADSLYVSSYEGGRIVPAIADLNADGMFDVVIGNLSGGVSLFYGDNTISIEELAPSTAFNLFPNPSTTQIVIETAEIPLSEQSFIIYDLSGKKISEQKISEQRTIINIENLPAGIYVCTMLDQKGFSVNKKLVISE